MNKLGWRFWLYYALAVVLACLLIAVIGEIWSERNHATGSIHTTATVCAAVGRPLVYCTPTGIAVDPQGSLWLQDDATGGHWIVGAWPVVYVDARGMRHECETTYERSKR